VAAVGTIDIASDDCLIIVFWTAARRAIIAIAITSYTARSSFVSAC
jgi:hypothetical protein